MVPAPRIGEMVSPPFVPAWGRLDRALPPAPSRLPALAEVKAARAWRPGRGGLDGCTANRTITETYDALDRAFAAYMGDPPLACWLTFGKYSSRAVGEWIRALEGAMTIAASLRAGSGLHVAARAAVALLGSSEIRPAAASRLRSLIAPRSRGTTPFFTQARGDPMHPLTILRDGLVEANTEIFTRLSRAFHVFLQAEAQGEDGARALRAEARSGAIDDVMGHMVSAFTHYQEARAIGVAARGAGPEERRNRLAVRRRLVAEANWLIAVQEQTIIQTPTIFDHPILRAAFEDARPGELELVLADRDTGAPPERFTLLPEGGNWADYATRLGLREVDAARLPEDGLTVTFPGRAERRFYALDPARRGTILDLFSRFLDGPMGASLQRGRPRDIMPIRV